MSLKAINESYRALLARALRSTVVAHKELYASNDGNATFVAFDGSAIIGVGGNATEEVNKVLKM